MTHALHIPADRGNVRTESIRALKHENALLDRVSWRAVTSACKPVAVLHWEMQQHGNEEDEIFLKCEDEGNADTDILVRHQAYTQCVLMGVWQNWIFSMWGILLCWGALQGADPAAGSSEGSSPECCLSFPPPPAPQSRSTRLTYRVIPLTTRDFRVSAHFHGSHAAACVHRMDASGIRQWVNISTLAFWLWDVCVILDWFKSVNWRKKK